MQAPILDQCSHVNSRQLHKLGAELVRSGGFSCSKNCRQVSAVVMEAVRRLLLTFFPKGKVCLSSESLLARKMGRQRKGTLFPLSLFYADILCLCATQRFCQLLAVLQHSFTDILDTLQLLVSCFCSYFVWKMSARHLSSAIQLTTGKIMMIKKPMPGFPCIYPIWSPIKFLDLAAVLNEFIKFSLKILYVQFLYHSPPLSEIPITFFLLAFFTMSHILLRFC